MENLYMPLPEGRRPLADTWFLQYRVAYPDVSRVEVINSQGRAFTSTNCDSVEIVLQDDGKTLKIFLKDRSRNDT